MTDKPKQSLADYVLEQKLAECAVCRLPADVRDELADARKRKGISRETVLAWLKKVHGATISDDEMTSHLAAHHDRKLRELQP